MLNRVARSRVKPRLQSVCPPEPSGYPQVSNYMNLTFFFVSFVFFVVNSLLE
jgi:hypothetical protein